MIAVGIDVSKSKSTVAICLHDFLSQFYHPVIKHKIQESGRFSSFFIKFTNAKRPVSLSTYRSENQDEADGIRTRDNLIKSQVLYRLSYSLAKQGQLDSNQRVQASKACALPLGDSPSISLLARVGNGIRIHDLQNHNLAR